MITNVREDRLLITSDTHIGSLFCNSRSAVVQFFEYAYRNGFNVCINGDGIDILHTSLRKIAGEGAAFLNELRRVGTKWDMTVYYVVGNHDTVLEHYIENWDRLHLVPFLNVTTGEKRIRIEHGHLYDPIFAKHRNIEDKLVRLSYHLCRVYPPSYHLYKRWQVMKCAVLYKLVGKKDGMPDRLVEVGEGPQFVEAAEELAERGFDVVIFGHTHNAGVVPLKRTGGSYINTGSWFRNPHYVEVNNGDVRLKAWP